VRTGYPYRNGYLCGEYSGLSCGPRRTISPSCAGNPASTSYHQKNRRYRRLHPDQKKPGLFYAMKEMSQMSKISAPQMAYPYNEKIINEIKYFIAFSVLKKLLKQEK